MPIVDIKWIKEELDKEFGVCQYCIHSPFDTCTKRKTVQKKKCKYFFRKTVGVYDGRVEINENINDSRQHTHKLMLYHRCPDCRGEIGHYQCNVCKGTGKAITPQGQQILDFIKQFLKE